MIRAAAVLCLVTAMTVPGCKRGKSEQQITVDATTRHQLIEGWGTSMIFWRLPDTPYQNPAWREAYRDLGLNILRININKEVLVDASGDLAVPVPLGADLRSNIAKMRFDNTKTKVFGEMAAWLVQNALEPERVKISGSIWSPPHWMKGPTGMQQSHVLDPSVKKPTPWLSEGTSGDSIGGRLVQTEANLEQFGRYLAAWLRGFEQHYGVPLYAASIQNELSFENPFDSASYFLGPNGEEEQWWQYAAALEAIKVELTRQKIRTRILGPHMAQVGEKPSNPWGLWQQMSYINAVKKHPDPELIGFLWGYNSNGYMGTDENAVKMWAAYYKGKAKVPADWAAWSEAPGVEADGKPVWISEAGGARGPWLTGKDGTAGEGAITVAQQMHNALVHGNASAYLYWQLSDTHDDETEHNLLGKKHIANPTESKKYAAFKHFSRYIRPGAVRVGAAFAGGNSSVGGKSTYDTYNSLNVSAYLHEADRTLTLVLVNMQASNQEVSILLPGALSVERLEVHLTSRSSSFARREDLRVSRDRVSLTIPAQSVVTLHGQTVRAR
jgi:O-glycosyl hydrolase